MLLPVSPEPFVIPTDRDMLPSERRGFVRAHRTCVLGYGRLHDGWAGPGSRRAAEPEGQPLRPRRAPAVRVSEDYADGAIDPDRVLSVDVLMAVAGRMSGEVPSDETRPFLESMADEEVRVLSGAVPWGAPYPG